jgi:hypothetical protein
MSSLTQRVVGRVLWGTTRLIAWLARRAGARLGPPPPAPWRRGPHRALEGGARFAGAAPLAISTAHATTADKAGRLVPLPEENREAEGARSLLSHSSFWAAVVLVLLVIGFGYLVRRLRSKESAARPPLASSPARHRRD